MPRSIPPPRFPQSIAPPPVDSETLMELEAVDVFERTATFPSDEILELEEVTEEAPTQTRPNIVLPRATPSARPERPREPWVVRAEALLDAIERMRDRPRRMALHRELAALLASNRDHDQAFEVLVAALAEDIDDEETVRALEELTRAHDRLGDLLRTALAWSEDIEWMRDRPRLGALLLRIAKWYGEDVDRVEWALPFAERARRLLPDRDPRPHRLLARLHRRAGAYDRAALALDEALARAPTAELRAELLIERGALDEASGGSPLHAYAAAFDADPSSTTAWSALDGAYAAASLAGERLAALERHVAALRAPAALEAARLRLVELLAAAGQGARAAAVLEDVLLTEAGHTRALDALIELRRHMRDWLGLRAALEHAVETKKVTRERIEHLMDLASLLVEAFADPDEAALRLEQVLELDPSHDVAFKALAALHQSRGHAHALAEVLERHARTASDRRVRGELLARAARVVAGELADRARALSLAERAVELVPNDPDALTAIAELHLADGRMAEADAALARALEHVNDRARRADLLLRRARAAEDRDAARALLEAALDEAPAHREALAERRARALAEGDYAGAARDCARELEVTERPQRRVPLLLELARLRADALDDREGALACWDEVLEIQPSNVEAATRLIEPYVEQSRWRDVLRLSTALLSAGAPDAARWHALHGRALKELGHAAEASRALAEAVRLRDDDVDAMIALAETRFESRDWAGAFAADTRLLSRLSAEDHERLLAVHHRMGRAHHELGRARGAIASLEQALALDPEHRASLEALADVHAARGAWADVAQCKRRLHDVTVNVDERARLLGEIADAMTRANQPASAVEALEEAADLRPRDLSLLHRLLDAYQRVGAWARMAEVLGRIAEIDREPSRRAKVLYTLGQLRRDKTGDEKGAAEAFEKALDDDASQLKAFEALGRLHTNRRDWKALERAYRRMLHRVAGRDVGALEVELWSGLGLVYRDRLMDDASAIEAFKMASRAKPEDARTRRILAELYARRGRTDDAATELHTAIAQQPLHAEPYRALFRLYRDAQRVDRAWCLAAALVLLDKADDDTRSYHARWQRRAAPAYRGRLDPPTFARVVRHPEEDLLVSKIFEVILPAVRQSRARRMGASIAPPAEVRWEEPGSTRVPLAHAFFGVADVLAIAPPRLTLRPDRDGGFVAASTEPPATAACRAVLSLQRNEDLLFVVGHHLSTWRADAHLRVLFPATRALESLLLAALKLGKPDLPLPNDAEARALDDARALAPHLQPVQLEALRVVAKKFVAEGGRADLTAWSRGLERTALRTGMLVCGDLATAVQGFDQARLAGVGLTASDAVSDLVAWFVSTDHLELRERLGIVLGPRNRA